MSRKILAIVVFVAAATTVYSKQVSLWGQGVFPDDRIWPLSYKTRNLDDSMDNELDSKRQNEDSSENEVSAKNYKICETRECQIVAEEFLGSMNKSVNPCDDFYEFACGGWSSKDPIPPSQATWSRFMMFQNTVERRIKEVLEEKPHPDDILPVRQAKKWYHACMNTDNLDRRGVKPIESILMQAGGWPIAMDVDEWDGDLYTWQMVERYYARLTGAYTMFAVEVLSGIGDDPDSGALRLKAPETLLSEQLPLKVSIYEGEDYDAYLRLIEKAVKAFVQHTVADVSKERITEEAKGIVAFEKEIYKLKREYEMESMSLDEFYEWYRTNVTDVTSDPKAKIDWESMIQGLFDSVNFKVNTSMDMVTTDFLYFRKIGELLEKTPSRTIVNYIHWNFVAMMLRYTTERARNDLFEILNEEFGVKERAPRWAECVDGMKMKHAAAYVFVDKYYTKSTEVAAMDMLKNVQIGLEHQITQSNWLDNESKKWAQMKLKNMKMFVGYPDWYKNKTAVINHYKGLTIGAELFDNELSYMRYDAKLKLKTILDTSDDLDIWSQIDPITVNAIYGGGINVFSVPAADFQTPLFTPNFPDNVNYATVGVIAGHEMGHGFDDSGIQYGESEDGPKLSADVLKNYYQRAECFLDQFEGYFEGYFENEPAETTKSESEGSSPRPRRRKGQVKMEKKTMGENIADSTGLQSVFDAYKNVNKKSPIGDRRLPGLEEYTDDQLFFLSFAAMWCEIERPEYKKKEEELKDVHSPPKFRVLGAVSNTKDFSKAFECPLGSPMNPSNKCNIWQKPGATIKKDLRSRSKKRPHHRWTGQWQS